MPQALPQFSVVIPAYQRARVIATALRSVYRQTLMPIEVIVVDDGSTDDIAAAVRDASDETSIPTRLLTHASNRGANAARNTGIEAARGSWIAFLDSDDVWCRNRLARNAEAIEASDSTVGVVYSAYKIVRTDGSVDTTSPYQRCCPEPIATAIGHRNVVGTCSAASVRRDILEQVNGLDEDLPSCQDWDLWIRCAQRTSFQCVDESLLIYTGGYGGRRITAQPSAVRVGHERLLQKHRSFIRATGGEGALFHRLGDICMREADGQAARRYFQAAVQHNPRRLKWWIKWGVSLFGSSIFLELRNILRRLRHLK